MSVNVKTTDGLQKIASNVTIAQADWNQRENTAKNTRILNQPETLTSMEEINANTNENALAGAMAVKEGIETLNDSLTKVLYSGNVTNGANITLSDDISKYTLLVVSGVHNSAATSGTISCKTLVDRSACRFCLPAINNVSSLLAQYKSNRVITIGGDIEHCNIIGMR